MDATTQALTTLIILAALVVSVIMTQFARRRRDFYPVRALPSYETAPRLVGQAIEAGRRVQVSSGMTILGGSSTALALASAEVLYQMASRTAIGGDPPISVSGDPSMLPLMMGAMRSAYRDAGRLNRYSVTSVRWYPSASLALAAAMTADIGDERVSGGVYVGEFDSSLALPLEAITRRRGISVAGSTQLEGQAVAYALADAPLLGEEMFVAGAYLGDGASHRAGLVTLDVLRWIVIAALVAGTALALRIPLSEALSGGG